MTLSAPYVARPEHRRISLHTHICTYPISTYLIDGQIKVNVQRLKKPKGFERMYVVTREYSVRTY